MTTELCELCADDGKCMARRKLCKVMREPFGGAHDPLYEDAVAIVREYRRGSISMVQRRLRIGYVRAALMLEAMEKHGLITPWRSDGSGRYYVEAVDQARPQFERKRPDDTEGGEL